MIRRVRGVEDVTVEILTMAEQIHDGWYPTGRVDWEDFLDRLDGAELDDGSTLDLGDSMLSPAVVVLKKYVLAHRREQ
jgi:hypothetical protein